MSDPNRNYCPEFLLADLVVDYLADKLDAETIGQGETQMLSLFEGACGLVSWIDPMTVDEADRIIVQCTEGNTMAESPANGEFMVEVSLQTLCQQKTMKADQAKHLSRLNDLRDKLFSQTLSDDLIALCPGRGIAVNFVQPVRHLNSRANSNWMQSGTLLRIRSFAIDN